MTLTRHVPQRRRRDATVPLAPAIAAAICVAILVGDVWFAFAGLRSPPLRDPVIRACPLSLSVRHAVETTPAEQLRIVGAGTCEDPLRVEVGR